MQVMGWVEFSSRSGGKAKDAEACILCVFFPQIAKRGYRRFIRNEAYGRNSGIPYFLVDFSKTTNYPTGNMAKKRFLNKFRKFRITEFHRFDHSAYFFIVEGGINGN